MCILSFTRLPFAALPKPILRFRSQTSATHLSVSVLASRATLPRSDFLLLYRGSYWSVSNRGRCRAGAGIGDLLNDAGATAIVLAGAYGLVLSFDSLTQRNLIQQQMMESELACAIPIHSPLLIPDPSFEQKTGPYIVGVAILSLLANFQDSTSTGARYFASLVPLVNCLRLVVHGLSLVSNEGLIKSVTREGKPEELLRGPLYYVLILIFCAVVFWRESPIGVISVSMMCAGDGIADIIGRKFGSTKISYNKKKSWAGSISMFVFGFLASIGMLYYYSLLGYFQFDWAWTTQRVALVSLVATVVESLPITEVVDDNISVPLASMVTAYLSFRLL